MSKPKTINVEFLKKHSKILETQFLQKMKDLNYQSQNGTKLENIHLYKTLQDLIYLYQRIAASREAINVIEEIV